MKVQFVNLQRQNKVLKNKIFPAMESVIKNAEFNMGPKLETFEKSFAAFCEKKYAVGVNSGTDALLLALMAYDIGPGDEVIVPANSYFSSAMVVSNVGAKPVLIDIDPQSYHIDIEKMKQAITEKTKVIMPIHLYGQAVNMPEILKVAKKHNIIVIEDACQAHGAMFKKKTVPYGDIGAFSFFPGKNLGAFGDGGAVVTNNKKIAEKILHLRNDGSFKKYEHLMFGIKSRLDTLQAAILQVKLPYLKKWNTLRRKHAALYRKLLRDIPEIIIQKEIAETYHVYHLFVIEYERRDALKAYLAEKGIQTIIHYPKPIHLQKPYLVEGYKKGDFPIVEEKAKKILSLPIFPEMKEEEIRYICSHIKKFISE